MKLFSGTAHPVLAEELSKLLQLPLAKAEVIRFGNSEVKVTIQEDVQGEDCIIVQPTANPTDTNLMELLLFCDALKREEAKKITAIIPYFGYARQNAQHRTGESISMQVVIKMLQAVEVDEIFVCTLHEEASAGMFPMSFHNLNGLNALVKPVADFIHADASSNIVAVTPDQEGVERARIFADELQALTGVTGINVAVTEKRRDLNNAHHSEALDLHGEVKDATCIIVDDIITSGGTVINSAKLCLERGAKQVICAITHSDFAPDSPEKLQNSPIAKFFTTNTISLKEEHIFPKLEVISVASLIAEKMKS